MNGLDRFILLYRLCVICKILVSIILSLIIISIPAILLPVLSNDLDIKFAIGAIIMGVISITYLFKRIVYSYEYVFFELPRILPLIFGIYGIIQTEIALADIKIMLLVVGILNLFKITSPINANFELRA